MKTDFSAVRGKRLLIALSGGADSVALAVLLARARSEYALELFAAHLDHGIRPESPADAAFCRELCEMLDIPLFVARLDIPAEAAERREGLETLARRRRYEWLRARKAEAGCDCIALAHHMDDQAETLIMHLGRGAGPGGLCGMRERSGDLYRPLLGFRKSELQAFLRAEGYTWREDATNAVEDTPRNALRLHAIPDLEQCYPQFVRAAARYAQSAQIESDYLAAVTEAYVEAHCVRAAAFAALEIAPLPPRAILRRALMAVSPVELNWDQTNALEALCHSSHGRLSLSGEWLAERAGRRLYYVPKASDSIAPVDLKSKGATRLPGVCSISARPCEPTPIRNDSLRQALNAEALSGAVVRTRRNGDRIRPLGSGDRLLSDYMTDKKLDRPLRDRVALVAVGPRVHWVCGLGISQEAAVSPSDSAVLLECEYDPNNGYHG